MSPELGERAGYYEMMKQLESVAGTRGKQREDRSLCDQAVLEQQKISVLAYLQKNSYVL